MSVGIDLAGKEDNPTGVTVLENRDLRMKTLYSDDEILTICRDADPDVVAIDSPLSFPQEGGLREADLKLINRGYQVLPPVLGGMRSLTRRGIRISEELQSLELKVIEVHPRTSALILFESGSRGDWISKLVEEGWNLDSEPTEHEIDSALVALTGYLYQRGRIEEIGKEGEEIVIPLGRIATL